MRKNADKIDAVEKLCIGVCEDLRLFASLYLAHYIVSRTLSRRRKERAARLKNLKLINGMKETSSMSLAMDEKGTSRQESPDFENRC